MLLRPGNAGSNTAADHLTVIRDALRQLPFPTSGRVGRKVLIRTDAAGCTHQVVDWLTARRLSYSLGFTLTPDMVTRIERIPDAGVDARVRRGRRPAGRRVGRSTRPACWTCTGWPAGMRVIVRAERPHPGAQLRFTDLHGNRLTAFATNTSRGQLADLELRHRRRARCEDRIRGAKDTGLTNLPLHDFTQNQIWLAIIALALDLTAWMQLLGCPRRPGAAVGTQTATAPHPEHRRPPRPPRQTSPASPATARAVAAGHHHRPDTTTRPTAGNPPLTPDQRPIGPVDPTPTPATPGPPATPQPRKETTNDLESVSSAQRRRPTKDSG